MKITNFKLQAAIFVFFTIISASQCLKDEESIAQKIRNFGTFILQHVELISSESSSAPAASKSTASSNSSVSIPLSSNSSDAAKAKQRQQRKVSNVTGAAKGQEKSKEVGKDSANIPVAKSLEPKQEEAQAPASVPFFVGQKIELPKYCKADQADNRLTKQELVSIAQDANKFVGGWNTAAGDKAQFNNLKDLNEKQFAQFYKAITDGIPDQPQTIKSSEAEAQSKDLLASVLFGDTKRTSVSWLEFWIYMCSGGIKPSPEQYMKSSSKLPVAKKDKKDNEAGAAEPAAAQPEQPNLKSTPPADDAKAPAADEAKAPVAEGPKTPAAEEAKPADDAAKPADDKPADDAAKPADDKPADDAAKPADDAAAKPALRLMKKSLLRQNKN